MAWHARDGAQLTQCVHADSVVTYRLAPWTALPRDVRQMRMHNCAWNVAGFCRVLCERCVVKCSVDQAAQRGNVTRESQGI